MDSLSSVSPSIVLPRSSTPLLRRHVVNIPIFITPHRNPSLSSSLSAAGWRRWDAGGSRRKAIGGGDSSGSDGGDASEDVEVERALRLDGTIPGTSDEFVKQVSSRAYDMRRHLHESLDSSSYDVLETNPWRETSKPVYVLTQKENQLCTMKTRRSRSEVERELSLLFPKGRKRSSEFGNQTKQSKSAIKFQMHVEDVREGVLVFEDQNEAVKYCDILQGKGQGCEGVAEIEASSVFDLCRQSRALAVLFRRGRTPPQPENLKLNLKAQLAQCSHMNLSDTPSLQGRDSRGQIIMSDGSGESSSDNSGAEGAPAPAGPVKGEKQKEKARVSKTSAILWHAHQNDAAAVRKLLEEDPSLVNARDYDNRTPLHVASLHGWLDVAKCLIEFGADVNAQDRWRNTPLADAEGAKKHAMIELLKSYGGLSYGQNGSHFEPKPVPPPLPNKCDWEIDPTELDFSHSSIIGKGSFGEILKAYWRGTPVAVKRILPSLSEDKLVIQDFRHEVNLLVKLRHPNIVQFLGACTEKKPLMLITEYLRGGDLHQHLKEKGALSPSTAVNFALDIARGMAYLHNEPNVIIHRDLKPRNVLLVNSNADHLKVGDFGLSKLIRVQHAHDVYKMTGETGSYRYMAPEVFKHRKYDKKVDVFSFAMILHEMLEGEPPMSNYEAYEAAKYVAEGHRPTFRSKGFTPELRELTEQCWSADKNQRPSFLEILKRLEKIKENLPAEHHWHFFSG